MVLTGITSLGGGVGRKDERKEEDVLLVWWLPQVRVIPKVPTLILIGNYGVKNIYM